MLLAGDFNINSWDAEYVEWIETEDLWELADPGISTHRSGAVDDMILLVAGNYIPEGVLPGEAESEKN